MATPPKLLRIPRSLLVGAFCALLGGHAASQSSLRCWGWAGYDTASRDGRVLQVDASVFGTAVLNADGRVYVNGVNDYGVLLPPPLGPGQRYVDMAFAYRYGVAVRNDGEIAVWGINTLALGMPPTMPPAPPLPVGTHYLQVSAAGHVLALRSDGAIVAWGLNTDGQCNAPLIPPGTTVQRLKAARNTSYAFLSNGSVLAWGGNDIGQLQLPSLPQGVTYTDIQLGYDHSVALRSDGLIEAWGSNQYGQLNIPSPPLGTLYTHIGAGWGHTQAARSDDVLVAWGVNLDGETDVPPIPIGNHCTALDCGYAHSIALLSNGTTLCWGNNQFDQSYVATRSGGAHYGSRLPDYRACARGTQHSVALLSDGTVQAWGLNSAGQCDVPSSLVGTSIRKLAASPYISAALLDSGDVVCWGDNSVGQCNVPPLPTGMQYTDVATGDGHTVLIRSDGQAVAFGAPTYGCTTIPPLPAGLRYVQCDAQYARTLLLRSDGEILVVGAYSTQQPPPPTPGTQYVEIGASNSFSSALQSDGNVQWWGSLGGTWGGAIWNAIPSLPIGVYYVEIDGGYEHVALRRSDGEVVVCGYVHDLEAVVPPLDSGTSYVEISANDAATIGRVGPTSTYVGIHQGCAGSMPPTRLVPRDTPRIGDQLRVTLFDLPTDFAMLAMSFEQLPSPMSLAPFGMPGCDWHIPLDAVVLLSGQNHQAQFELPIPNRRALIGLHFFHQALVLDPNSGNSFGAVVSDTVEGVVGDR